MAFTSILFLQVKAKLTMGSTIEMVSTAAKTYADFRFKNNFENKNCFYNCFDMTNQSNEYRHILRLEMF